MSTENDFADLARVIRETIFQDLRVAFAVVVRRVDNQKGLVDVQPVVREQYEADTGDILTKQLEVIPSVPIEFPGAGGFRITFPIQVGDTGHCVVSDVSLDKWLSGQGDGVDQDDPRRHDMTDAVFRPGLRTSASPWTGIHAQHATMGKDGGLQVFFQSDKISLGQADAPNSVALAENVKAALDSLRLAIAGWTPVPADGGAALKTALTTLFATPWPPSNLGSATVKVKG